MDVGVRTVAVWMRGLPAAGQGREAVEAVRTGARDCRMEKGQAMWLLSAAVGVKMLADREDALRAGRDKETVWVSQKVDGVFRTEN